MKAPRYWRKLERHPLGEEYPNIEGAAWKAFVANVRDNKIVGKRKITLHEGKVIDGFQLYRACLELDIKPDFQPLPKGITPEAFVETMNDHRRHENQETAMARAAARRERVAAARAEGQSERAIAEQEGVSPKTIHQDIQTLGATGVAPQPASGKVTGRDGVEQPAQKPQTRAERVGQKPPTPFRVREPGDDTEDIEAEKAANKGRPRNGQVLFDWKPWESAYGALVRQIDVLGNAYRAKESPKAEKLRGKLQEFYDAFKAWHKDLSKSKA